MSQASIQTHESAGGTTFPVRLLRESDLPEISQIIAVSPTAPQWTAAQLLELAGNTTSAALQRVVLVAEAAGGPVGFAVATVLKVVYPAEAELESIAVAPAMRGKGIGSALMQAVFAWAGEQEAGHVRLEVRASNRNAFELYQKAGFNETGVRRGYYVNPSEDAICMSRTIASRVA